MIVPFNEEDMNCSKMPWHQSIELVPETLSEPLPPTQPPPPPYPPPNYVNANQPPPEIQPPPPPYPPPDYHNASANTTVFPSAYTTQRGYTQGGCITVAATSHNDYGPKAVEKTNAYGAIVASNPWYYETYAGTGCSDHTESPYHLQWQAWKRRVEKAHDDKRKGLKPTWMSINENGEDYCNLCWKVATEGHLASPKHRNKEWYENQRQTHQSGQMPKPGELPPGYGNAACIHGTVNKAITYAIYVGNLWSQDT